jgi:hypothetical protein
MVRVWEALDGRDKVDHDSYVEVIINDAIEGIYNLFL